MLRTPAVLLALVLCSPVCGLAQTAPLPATAAGSPSAKAAAPAYESDPKFTAAMAEAKQLERQHRYVFARDAYVRANKVAGGSCILCLQQMAAIDDGLHDWKKAIEDAHLLQQLAVSPREKSIADERLGQILMDQAGDKPKPAQLEAAHAVFQDAIQEFPRNLAARWSDGCVLARMGKDELAKEQFTACAQSASAADPMHMRALHFAENPALALHKMAPAFEVTALDGSRFNLDNMGGRVVLIDFWATWCGPCNEELPGLKHLAKEFANEPLTIISISWDADETKWKSFIAKNEMTWMQYRDADHKLSEEFGVNAIPHYFTIDSDGVLTAEMLGSGNDVEGKLKKLLKRARESKPVVNEVAAGAQ